MNTRNFLKGALLSAVLAVTATGAMAGGSVTLKGETSGLALGAALPEGFYFLNTGAYLNRSNTGLEAIVSIPVLAWSTPWDLLGGHVEAYVAAPVDGIWGTAVSPGSSGFYNPAAFVGEAWNLGGGFHVSEFLGGYAPEKSGGLASNNWVFNTRTALTYLTNGWDFTAHAIYGVVGKNLTNNYQTTPDYFNLDLTAVKSLGKWEVGPVAYYSTNTSTSYTTPTANLSGANATYAGTGTVNGSQDDIAVGALVGYNFPGITLQLYLTREIEQDNQGGHDTMAFFRTIIPLQ